MMRPFYHNGTTAARRRSAERRAAPALRLAAAALACLAIIAPVGGQSPAGGGRADGPPYSPEGSMRTMQLEQGFRIELVASEPDVQSPVAIDFDEDGRLFVVEMPGYPVDVSPSGRVKLLEDRDGDGRFERSSVFADGLVLPTGVARWRRGVLVTAAPDVLYLEDADDDGRAERREVVLTGFPFTNPQHTVNGPLYGLDNWIYLANQGPAEAIIYRDLFGDRGTSLTFPRASKDAGAGRPFSTVRVRPEALEAEAIAGESQFGHAFDAYGRYFGNDNSHHLWHEVLAARYLRRNPHLRVRRAMHDVPDHGGASAVFPVTERPTFELLTEAGEFTSACAPTLYLGGALPAGYEGSVFVAEPVHNLVHRDVIAADGPTFTARRAEPQREFLAAGDPWFRPVFMTVGPDGALYIVDYYRPRIEHPEWTSSDLQRDPRPLFEGRERGRIYRVAHESMKGARRPPRLGSAATEALVAALADPNVWWRRTAQRLLVERREPGAVPALEALVRERPGALARLHALWTLQGLAALEPALVLEALADPDPGVRENGIVLAELTGGVEDLADRLVAMAEDPDPRVRFSVLAALGSFETAEAVAAHERLLFAEIDDRWMQLAGLSAPPGRAIGLLARALEGPDAIVRTPSEGRARFVRLAAGVVASRGQQAEVARVIRLAAQGGVADVEGAWWRAAALEGVADGAAGATGAAATLAPLREALLDLQRHEAAAMRRGALRLLRLSGGAGEGAAARQAIRAAEAAVVDESADPERRADAATLLALDASADWMPLFRSLVDPKQPEAVQAAAVTALGGGAAPDLGDFLIERWPAFTPAVRGAAARVLLGRPLFARRLVEALRSGDVQPWTLGFWEKRDLLMHEDPDIRAAARAVLEEDPAGRERTLERYARALSGGGDSARGEQVFVRACATCHALGGGAADLGPDLATVRHRPPLLLLADILAPSRSIAQHYETWLVERVSGGTEAGLLAAQTPTSVTLRQAPGREVTIPRQDIRAMTALPESAMPADLDRVITPEEMADLLAFIRGGAGK